MFLDDLPVELKIDISVFIHKLKCERLDFLSKKSKSFICWFCPQLKQLKFREDQYIFHEGDDLSALYFQSEGKSAFVLENYGNVQYIDIKIGNHFGLMEISL